MQNLPAYDQAALEKVRLPKGAVEKQGIPSAAGYL